MILHASPRTAGYTLNFPALVTRNKLQHWTKLSKHLFSA